MLPQWGVFNIVFQQPAPAPAPAPYSEHQFYDGINEFNDRYSFNQASSNSSSGRYYHEYDNRFLFICMRKSLYRHDRSF